MKNAVYAISLLSAFLVLLVHDLVPHRHDIQGYGATDLPVGIQTDNHHSREGHHSQKHHSHSQGHHSQGHHDHDPIPPAEEGNQKPEQNRKSSFPYHNHLFTDTDLEYTRISTHSPVRVKQVTKAPALHSAPGEDSAHQQEHSIYLCRNKPFLIRSLFQPAAHPLRGPPSIA